VHRQDCRSRKSGLLSLPVTSVVVTQAPISLDPARLVLLLWLLGVAATVITLVIGVVRLGRLASRARLIEDGQWAVSLADIARGDGVHRKVHLLHSDHPTLLVTWGFAPSKIILPAAAQGWADDRIRVVLHHELAHIRRADWVVQILAEQLRAVACARKASRPVMMLSCARESRARTMRGICLRRRDPSPGSTAARRRRQQWPDHRSYTAASRRCSTHT
jgi:BlaR1 peptidase M56